jgi:transposase InsO family protein
MEKPQHGNEIEIGNDNTAKVKMEQPQHGNEFEIRNDNTAEVKMEKPQHGNEIEIGNDNTAKVKMEQPQHGNEFEIRNENTAEVKMEKPQHGKEFENTAKVKMEQPHHGNEFEIRNENTAEVKMEKPQHGKEFEIGNDNTAKVKMEQPHHENEFEIENDNIAEFKMEQPHHGNDFENRNENTAEVKMEKPQHGNEFEIGNDNTAKVKMEQPHHKNENDNTAKVKMEQPHHENEFEIENDNTAEVKMEQPPHGNEIEIGNDNTAEVKKEQPPHRNETEIGNDNTAEVPKEQPPHGNEIEIGNDNNAEVNTEQIPHGSEIETGNDVIDEIEWTKQRIQTEIANTIDRTNAKIDSIFSNATSLKLDTATNEALMRAQTSMETEIVRLDHVSGLMLNLCQGINKATTVLRAEFKNANPTFATESPTLAHENPTFANGSPTLSNENPTFANESPTLAHENPTFANGSPTLAHANLTFANLPSVTFADERPTFPTIPNERLDVQLPNDTILMVTDHSPLAHDAEDEQSLLAIDAERIEALRHDLYQLSIEEQRIQDRESSQFLEDILYHENDSTDQIIASFEHLCSSSEDNDDYGPNNHPSNDNSSSESHNSSGGNAIDRNFAQTEQVYGLDADIESDVDDDTENINELLAANMKLLNFLTQQRQTIARLRVRIVSLKTLIYDLSSCTVPPLSGVRPPTQSRGTSPTFPQHQGASSTPPAAERSCAPTVRTYYGIQRGPIIGVCDSYAELLRRIDGSPNSIYQSFSTWQAAEAFVIEGMSHTPLHHADEQASVLVDTVNSAHPEMDASLLIKPNMSAVDMSRLNYTQIQEQLELQLDKITKKQNIRNDELWMYYDSGASRSVISTTSPVRQHLQAIGPAYGSCSIGDGRPLHYLEKGHITDSLEVTVVSDLKFDLFSSVSAAKQGLSSVIDYDLDTGQNRSFTIDKLTGHVTPLVERGKGILELPLHLMLPSTACVTIPQPSKGTQDALPPNIVSMFWHNYDDNSFDLSIRENNTTDHALFTFDIIKSLSERERHFLIHARLGHLPRHKILQMIKNGTTGISDYTGKFKELCKPCFQARQRAENHGKEHARHPKGRPGEHLHSDLAVLSTVDINGNKYALTVVDEISHEIVVALLKRKTAVDVQRICKTIQLSITARTGNKLLTWQFDRGTEFLNHTFERWLKMDLGVIQRFSNIEHPWENGMAERSFQTLFTLARSLLKHADLPDRLWGKAVLHSVYIINRSPAVALGGIAPLQFRTKAPIDLHNMRVFGSPAQIFVRPTIRADHKLADRSISGTFVGMSDKGNGYIFLISKSNRFDDFVEVDSKDAKFNETFSDYRGRQGKIMTAPFIDPDLKEEREINHEEIESTATTSDVTNDKHHNDKRVSWKDEQHHDRPKRNKTPRQFLIPGTHELDIRRQQYSNLCLDNFMEQGEAIFLMECMEASVDEETILLKELELLTACTVNDADDELLMPTITNQGVNLDIPDPKSQNEIDRMDPEDARRFNDATVSEVNGMKGKNVFVNTTMDALPPNTKVYESIVNWTSKTNLGIYVKTKCRICFGGHRYDKSYTDTFAPTVNFCTVLVIICLSAMFGWAMGSLDYSQAYLNADIDEICVMRAPISVREYSPNGKEYFWLLKKAIYGHPKASRLWAECLHKKLLELGYIQFLTDQCVYGRWQTWDASIINDNEIPEDSHFVFLLIHSDDIIIVSHNAEIMNEAKAELLNAFQGTDNGNLTSFCGVEVRTNDDQTSLSMEYYWNKLMKKFDVKDDEIEPSPLKTKIKRSECPAEPDAALKTNYLQIIGSIIYGYTHCRLDLAFPINMLTRIMHSPAEQHYNLLRKLLQYINGTKNWTLNYYRDYTMYYGMDFTFFCNVDAAHADDDETFRSTGGWFFFLRKGQGAVAAKSGQTKDIPLSSTESETIWGSSAAMQGAFLKQFLDETRLFKSTSFEIHEDSQPMINAQKRNVSQSRFKHMKTKHHYIRKLIYDGWCKLVKISSKTNTADMATKILPAKQVSIFSKIVLGLQESLLYFTDTEFD